MRLRYCLVQSFSLYPFIFLKQPRLAAAEKAAVAVAGVAAAWEPAWDKDRVVSVEDSAAVSLAETAANSAAVAANSAAVANSEAAVAKVVVSGVSVKAQMVRAVGARDFNRAMVPTNLAAI